MQLPSRSTRSVRPLCLALLGVLAPAVGGATSYTITTFADDAVVNSNCTLREALRAADTNLAVDGCIAGDASDTISLPTGTYLFSGDESLGGAGSIAIQSQTLDPLDVTIDLNSSGRFLRLQGPASYVLGGISFVNGLAPAAPTPLAQGGVIRAIYVSLRIFNFRFENNEAPAAGGALFFASSLPGAQLLLEDGEFDSNHVTGSSFGDAAGGAVSASVSQGADAAIRDVQFFGNSAAASSVSVRGGALSLQASDSDSDASCVRCLFQNNAVVSIAGAPGSYVEGGALSTDSFNGARTEIVDSTFAGNYVSAGAVAGKVAVLMGTSSGGSTLLLERLRIDANGGAVDPLVSDVGIYNVDSGSTTSFYDSLLTWGANNGLLVDGNSIVALGHLTIADYPLTGTDLRSSGGQILLQNSIAAFNGANLVTSGSVSQTTNFIGGDPQFVNRPGGDYHLSALSPAINAGTNGVVTMRLADLDRRGRRAGPATDIGCYEVNGLFAHGFDTGDLIYWSP